ncbi:MAG: septal ring lytic transglycosylase RlpA family protein [Bacteroidetes bacterium]|nr:septal ring lytic transglycosylase RlpA family protein [Bacteroidota bacterium]
MSLIKTIWCVFLLLHFSLAFSQISYRKIGMASFYHDKFEGRKTSSGEIFRQKKLTCAHRNFPFGTRVKVTNLENEKSVIVRVNDRGPYSKGRMIDLTSSAARKLGFIHDGEVEVAIEVMSCEGVADSLYLTTDTLRPFYIIESLPQGVEAYSIKIGSYLFEQKVLEVIREVKGETNLEVFVQAQAFNKNILYRIFAGKFKKKGEAEEQRGKILDSFPECYVVEMIKEEQQPETK